MMQQSSRRPPQYPTPTIAPRPLPASSSTSPSQARSVASPPQPAASRPGSPPPPPAAPAYGARSKRDVVVRSIGLKLLSVGGILHASMILMTLVIILVMAMGGDARVALVVKTIKAHGPGLWTWTLFATFTSFVLGFVMLYNAIGTLSLTPWSARTAKLWSGTWLVLSSVALIINLGWIFPILRDASPDRFSPARLLILTCLHVAAGIIWPGIVLAYMNTRHIKRSYARVAEGASAM